MELVRHLEGVVTLIKVSWGGIDVFNGVLHRVLKTDVVPIQLLSRGVTFVNSAHESWRCLFLSVNNI